MIFVLDDGRVTSYNETGDTSLFEMLALVNGAG